MESTLGKYSPNMVLKFYASYAATVINTKPPKAKEVEQPPLLSTLIHGVPVDILDHTI